MTSENPSSKGGSLFSEASIPLESAFLLFQGVLIVVIGLSIYGIEFSGGLAEALLRLTCPVKLGCCS